MINSYTYLNCGNNTKKDWRQSDSNQKDQEIHFRELLFQIYLKK